MIKITGSLLAIPSSLRFQAVTLCRHYRAQSAGGFIHPPSPSTMKRIADSSLRLMSTQWQPESTLHNDEENGPTGILFSANKPLIGVDLLGATGMIQRTFGPRSNAEGLLATGGAALAAHASFDPDYRRAQDWIRHHAVGPAVLSPILIAGLTGALTEAAFPHGVNTAQSMRQSRPLIVGVSVAAMIEVMDVQEARRLSSSEQMGHDSILGDDDDDNRPGNPGYNVVLRTAVTRVRDDCVIAEGSHELWVPDYACM